MYTCTYACSAQAAEAACLWLAQQLQLSMARPVRVAKFTLSGAVMLLKYT